MAFLSVYLCAGLYEFEDKDIIAVIEELRVRWRHRFMTLYFLIIYKVSTEALQA